MNTQKILFLFVTIILMGLQVHAQQKYTTAAESLKQYQVPEWYQDAKLGFWVHWGLYSVPAFKGDHAAEWYGRWMYCQKGQSSRNNQGYATHLHHIETYGDPDKFGYKDFVPMFKAENFDADEWINLCINGGAKFFTMMGSHHDTYCLWDTKLSKWNAVQTGPHRDLVGEIAAAARKRNFKFGVSNHSAWNYMFFMWNHINRYDAADPANQDLYGNPVIQSGADTIRMYPGESRNSFEARSRGAVKPSERDLNRWIARTKELNDLYQPDLYYFDWGMNAPEFESRRYEFAAHYYKKAIENGKGTFGNPNVVLNYKGRHTLPPGSAVLDFERSSSDYISPRVWQTDDCVYDDHNWGYVPGTPIKPTNRIVDQLIDIVSKNGVLMLSFAPKPDGTFPESQQKLMRELGAWLKVCGEAVYATRPYEIFGERPTGKEARDEMGRKKYEGTGEDIRFTRNKENTVLYATVLDWPGEKMLVKSLATTDVSGIKKVSLLGTKGKLKWKQTSDGLEISMPEKPDYGFAYPVKIEFKGKLPSVN